MSDVEGGQGARVWINPAAGHQASAGPGPAWRPPGERAGAPGEPAPAGAPPGGPRRPGRHRRARRWPRRALIGVNVVVLICLVGVGLTYAYARYRGGQIPRIPVQGLRSPKARPPGSGKPETILLVGSDTRAGLSKAQAASDGSTAQVSGQRSDVDILVHLVPATGKVAMLSIPRDTFVPIPGTGGSNRVNSAFNHGPSLLVKTITQDFHIPIDHYAEVGFDGLEGLVNTVGGICMHFPYPARDVESGLNIPTAGNHILKGPMALSLVRSRYYQYEKDGQWIAEGTGDLGRINRQHEFLRVLAETAIHRGIFNPFTANRLIGQAVHDVVVDKGMTTSDMIHLLLEFRSAHPSQIPSWTLPTQIANNYGIYGDVLLPERAQDQAVIRAWEDYGMPASHSSTAHRHHSSATTTTTSSTVPPASVQVQVLNGSGATGQAAQTAQELRTAGFGVTTYGDASSYTYQSSIISYGPGHAAQARTLAAHVEGGAQVQADPSLQGPAVVLTTGSSFQGISASGTSAPTTTTTTTAPSGSSSSSATAPSSLPPWDPTACT